MANLVNSTPLNVPVPLKASGLPAAGSPGFATPHTSPPVLAVPAHTTVKVTYANVAQKKE